LISNGCNKVKLLYDKYFSTYNEIKYFHHQLELVNSGILHNIGNEMATGQYVTYLNQNDIIGNKHLEIINENLNNNDLCYYDIYHTLTDTFKNLKKTYIELRFNSITQYSIIHKKTNIKWTSGIGNEWKFIMQFIFKGHNFNKIKEPQYIKGDIIYDDLVSNKLLTDIKTKKIAVLLHLYYLDLWDEIFNKLKKIDANVDIYVNLVKGSVDDDTLSIFVKNISSLPNIKIFISENVGLDIGGTLIMFDDILKNNKQYDYLLKLHGKKSIHSGRDKQNKQIWEKHGEDWRNNLIDPILGEIDNINNTLSLFDNSKEIGMIGSKSTILSINHPFALRNMTFISDYSKKMNINVNLNEIIFVAGTMFWVRFDIFKKYFTLLSPSDIFSELESGSFTDAKGETRTHALERVFGLMVLNENMKIVGV
jgi:hypothetical protein